MEGAGKKLWGWYKTGKVWVPVQVDINGIVQVDMSAINLDDLADVNVPAPADGNIIYWDDATSLWKCKAPVFTKIADADGDTKVDVEEAADEDKVRMDVKGVEAFLLHDDGILDLAKQSAARAFRGVSDQDIPRITWTKVELNVEQFDVQSEFDIAVNYRFTAKKAGYYAVCGNVGYHTFEVDKRFYVGIYKNGAAEAQVSYHASVAMPIYGNVSAIVDLAVDGFLELWTWHDCAVARPIYADRTTTYLSVAKIA